MIHLALFLVALVIVITFASGTLSVIGAAFEANAGLGFLAILAAVVFWFVVLVIVL